MVKTIFFWTAGLFFIGQTCLAQGPVLNAGVWTQPNLNCPYSFSLDTLQLDTGINQLWDLSTINLAANYQENFINVNSAPGNSFFPNATVVGTSAINPFQYRYIQVTPTENLYLGNYYSDISMDEIYQPSLRDLIYPCAYGTTWADSIGGSLDRWRYYAANGYGSVLLPSGSLSGVLLISILDTSSFTNSQGNTTSTVWKAQVLMSPSSHCSVALLTQSLSYSNSTVVGEYYTSVVLDLNSLSIAELFKEPFNVYPNPVSEVLYVERPGSR